MRASSGPRLDRYQFELNRAGRDQNRAAQTRDEDARGPSPDSNNAAVGEAGVDCGSHFFTAIYRHACRFAVDRGEFDPDLVC